MGNFLCCPGGRCLNGRIAPEPRPEAADDLDFLKPEDAKWITAVKLTISDDQDKLEASLSDKNYTINIVRTEDPGKMRLLEKKSPATWVYYINCNAPGVLFYFPPLVDLEIRRVDAVEFKDLARTIGPDLVNYYEIFNAHTVSITKESVTSEELEFIRERFPRIQRFKVTATLPREEINFSLNYMEVKMFDGRGITMDDLRGIQCTRLEIHDTDLKASELKELVYSWFKAECWQNLQCLVIRHVNADIPSDQFLRGYKTFTWKETKRGRYFVQDENIVFDCSEEKDIKRLNDEQVATVIFHKNTFRFYVWKELLPQMPRNGFTTVNRDAPNYLEFSEGETW
ncbi:hypothetical protein CAEBREN_05952 [Caenorhabditis brenneri]|uniref:F-box associated domain-containing protein n=1 Tax=Caenorhabditis brenneri TaxID=135651 RepID=G0MC05_CAEBE|nr:hypothetical protein CAEBREN_05952 [Caenorhabditis brenneri]